MAPLPTGAWCDGGALLLPPCCFVGAACECTVGVSFCDVSLCGRSRLQHAALSAHEIPGNTQGLRHCLQHMTHDTWAAVSWVLCDAWVQMPTRLPSGPRMLDAGHQILQIV